TADSHRQQHLLHQLELAQALLVPAEADFVPRLRSAARAVEFRPVGEDLAGWHHRLFLLRLGFVAQAVAGFVFRVCSAARAALRLELRLAAFLLPRHFSELVPVAAATARRRLLARPRRDPKRRL